MARKIKDKAAEAIDTLLKADKVSVQELATRVGITRSAVYGALDGNMLVDTFIKYLDALGYGISIRPKNEKEIDYVTQEMCENCVHKRLSDAFHNSESVRALRGSRE